MADKNHNNRVTLKEAFITGILLDLLLLAMASLIMDCGTLFMRTFFLVLAHLTLSIWLVFRKKNNLSRWKCDFVRFGILLLVTIAFSAMFAISIFMEV